MTDATLTDPTALAREVLDLAHEDETVTVCSIPDNKVAALARAVIELDAERDAYIEENTRLREMRAHMEALEAVLKVHVEGQPFYGHGFSRRMCECGFPWPCPTVEAITDALDGE